MKQQIISEINGKLASMGIAAQQENGADITIHAEFLDAGWSTGSKKISYEASIFANEQEKTVYMYEKTTEIGHGLSFGGDSGTSFQSGTTLFRKVKSVQYGTDGKAYEYTLDLGAIPKAVKETAKFHDWRFKTVINKNKAMYPAGYVPVSIQPAQQAQTNGQTVKSGESFCSNCGMPLTDGAKFCSKCGKPVDSAMRQTPVPPPVSPPQSRPDSDSAQPQYGNPQGPFYADTPKKGGKKGGTLGFIGFILLGIVLFVMLLAAEATPVGWVACLVLFAIAFFIQRKLRQRGCVLHLILWIITGFFLLISLTMFTEGDLSLTTAGLKNAHMTTAMDANGKPVDKVTSYLPGAPELVAVAELRNAPIHTQVKFVWSYVTHDVLITEYIMDSGENDANVYVFSSINNDKPWPEGKYKVEMYVADRSTPDETVTFTVSANTDASADSNLPKHHLYYGEADFQKGTTRIIEVNVANGEEKLLFEKPLYLGMLHCDNGKIYAIADNRVGTLENGKIKYITAEDEYVVRFDVHNGMIYYGKDNSNASDNIFERLALKDDAGKNEKILNDGGISQLIVDDYVYCAISSGTDIAKLVRYNLDGSNKIILYDKAIGQLVKFGGYLYFINHSDSSSLYRMKNDGTDVKKMVQGPLNLTNTLPNQINGITNIGAIDNYVYYINSNDGNKLYKTDGSSSEKITDDVISSIYIEDNYIYCTYKSPDKTGIYLLDRNGKEIKKITSAYPSEYIVEK